MKIHEDIYPFIGAAIGGAIGLLAAILSEIVSGPGWKVILNFGVPILAVIGYIGGLIFGFLAEEIHVRAEQKERERKKAEEERSRREAEEMRQREKIKQNILDKINEVVRKDR